MIHEHSNYLLIEVLTVIAWPVVVFLLGVLFLLLFRRPLSKAITKWNPHLSTTEQASRLLTKLLKPER